jgi:hypothetical protein
VSSLLSVVVQFGRLCTINKAERKSELFVASDKNHTSTISIPKAVSSNVTYTHIYVYIYIHMELSDEKILNQTTEESQ